MFEVLYCGGVLVRYFTYAEQLFFHEVKKEEKLFCGGRKYSREYMKTRNPEYDLVYEKRKFFHEESAKQNV